MTHEDFELIAAALKAASPTVHSTGACGIALDIATAQHQRTYEEFARRLALVNPRFDYVAEYVLRTVHGSQRKPGDTLLAAAGDFERDPLACPDCWGLGRGKGYVGTSPGRCWSCNGNGLDPAAFIRPPARSGCPRHAPPDCASRAADDLFDRE